LFEFIKGLQSEKKHDSLSEEATKMKFILGILSQLGWSTYNPDEVFPEYDVGGGRVDYALRHMNANKVFIEAKKVREALVEKHEEQLLTYSFKSGVKIAVLTNGLTWWFYLPLHEGNWEQRKFYTIEIPDQKVEDITNKFDAFLSRENVMSGNAILNAEKTHKGKQRNDLVKETLPKAWEKLVNEPEEKFVDLISDTTEKLCGIRPEDRAVRKFVSAALKPGKVVITPKPVKPILKPKTKPKHGLTTYTGKSIVSFTFQGNKYEITKWIELLTSICAIMATTHKDNVDLVLNLVGKKRPYFSKNPDEIRKPRLIESTDIYFETNLSSTRIMKMCIGVLQLFGYKPGDLSVETK